MTAAHQRPQDTDVGVAIRKSITRGVVSGTGLHEQLAVSVAEQIYRELSREFGGGRLWWPTLDDNTERDQVIRRRWRAGEKWRALIAEYGISRSRFYQIVNGE